MSRCNCPICMSGGICQDTTPNTDQWPADSPHPTGEGAWVDTNAIAPAPTRCLVLEDRGHDLLVEYGCYADKAVIPKSSLLQRQNSDPRRGECRHCGHVWPEHEPDQCPKCKGAGVPACSLPKVCKWCGGLLSAYQLNQCCSPNCLLHLRATENQKGQVS